MLWSRVNEKFTESGKLRKRDACRKQVIQVRSDLGLARPKQDPYPKIVLSRISITI